MIYQITPEVNNADVVSNIVVVGIEEESPIIVVTGKAEDQETPEYEGKNLPKIEGESK